MPANPLPVDNSLMRTRAYEVIHTLTHMGITLWETSHTSIRIPPHTKSVNTQKRREHQHTSSNPSAFLSPSTGETLSALLGLNGTHRETP